MQVGADALHIVMGYALSVKSIRISSKLEHAARKNVVHVAARLLGTRYIQVCRMKHVSLDS